MNRILLVAVFCPFLLWISISSRAEGLFEYFDGYPDSTNWTGGGIWRVEIPFQTQVGPRYAHGGDGKGMRILSQGVHTNNGSIYKTGLDLRDNLIEAIWHVNLRDKKVRYDLATRGCGKVGGVVFTLSQVTFVGGSWFAQDGPSAISLGAYSTGIWQKITTRIDLNASRYNLYTNDVLVASNLHFDQGVTNVANVDWVIIGKNSLGDGEAWFDDVTIAAVAGDKTAPSTASMPMVWLLPLGANLWKTPDQKGGARKTSRVVLDSLGGVSAAMEETAAGKKTSAVRDSKEGVIFEVIGVPPENYSMKWEWKSALSAVSKGFYEHYVLRYKTRGIQRSNSPLSLITASGVAASGKRTTVPLLDAAQAMNDGQWHTLTGKLKKGFTPCSLQVEFSTRNSTGSLEIGSLTFQKNSSEKASAFTLGEEVAISKDDLKRFRCLDLTPSFNDNVSAVFERLLEQHGIVLNGGSAFKAETISADGVPFHVRRDGNNLILPVENTAVNQDKVGFLGAQVSRIDFGPISRDDTTEIKVGQAVNEVFFYLVSELQPSWQPGGTSLPGLGLISFQLDDIENFAVELVYADGESDFAFPYSISDNGFVIRRMGGAYAVPADKNRTLRSVILHNRTFGNTVGIAAATVNLSDERVLPKLAQEPELIRVPSHTPPPARAPYLTRKGNQIQGGNSFYDFSINCEQGFSLEKLVNRWSQRGTMTLKNESGLEVEMNGRTLDGRAFHVEKITIQGTTSEITLLSKESSVPLQLNVEISVDVTPQLKMNLSALNTGGMPVEAMIRFPSLRGLKIGALEDTWMFFPQARDVNSNQPGFYQATNDRSFPMQFFDIYNPRLGIGLALLTHNQDNAPVDYCLSKNADGVSASVKYPKEIYILKPGESRKLTETCLVVHGGDWHQALAAYQEWLATWYKPVRSQDKDWFQRAFWIRSNIISEALSAAINHTPPILDRKKGVYRIDEVLQADKTLYGALPDLMHFFGWYASQDDSSLGGEWGGSIAESYALVGGLPLFKSAIQSFQKDHGMPMSLYFLPSYAAKASDFGKKNIERLSLRQANGDLISDDQMWIICHAMKEARDDTIATIRQVQADTQAEIIYLDVFGFTRQLTCYSQKHGHKVPSWCNQDALDFLRELRAALPPEVAIWNEFPVTDFCSQYTDGNITYYFLRLDKQLSPSYDLNEEPGFYSEVAQTAYRFALPGVRQFSLPFGIQVDTWGRLKFVFFNGDGFFDTTWRLHSTRGLQLINKSLTIKRQYVDCFTSRHPVPMVPTERAGVCANRFPGQNRTLWTLYNSRYTTVRGTVLSVEHREGATYRDLWNDQSLSPVIRDGKALLTLKLDPEGLGCVVQEIPHALKP